MTTITPRFDEMEYNRPYKDGEYDATLVKYLVNNAEQTYEIPHGLGRVPQKVDKVFSDCMIIFETNERHRDKVICTFFENDVTIVLRFE